MVDRVVRFFTSLRLTVVLLGLGLVLVFIGTLAQVHEGLYQAQVRYFKSWFIWGPTFGDTTVPIPFPGGYLIGTLLLINLLAAHIKRFQFTVKKIGIHLTHGGLILLLLGQLLTDLFSTESAMRLAEGEVKNYSEDFRDNELVVIDKSDERQDRVISIPEAVVAKKGEIRDERLPVTLRVKEYWENSALPERPEAKAIPVAATTGFGVGAHIQPLPPVVSPDERNVPSALIEVLTSQGSLGTWLVSCWTSARQEFAIAGRTYQLALRFSRYYKPFSLRLLEFRHERYRGTDIPKNFQSRVRIENPAGGENREVDIYMNNPLRYNGETYYQAGFDKFNDQRANKITILQVVHNPSWLTPYLSCALVFFGLVIQFLMHLGGFIRKSKTA
jgi:hypothetical protein